MNTVNPSHPIKSRLRQFWLDARFPPEDPKTSLFQGKTVLICEPHSLYGHGYEAAIKVAKLGAASVVLVVDYSYGAVSQVTKDIAFKSGANKENIHIWDIKMSDLSSVENGIRAISYAFPRVDHAVLNIDDYNPARCTIPCYDIESTLQENVFAAAYMALLLLPILRESSRTQRPDPTPSRLVFVTNICHGDVKETDIMGEKPPRRAKAYANNGIMRKMQNEHCMESQYRKTNLLQMWIMRQIAHRTSPSEVIVTSCCPGLSEDNYIQAYQSQNSGHWRAISIAFRKYLCRDSTAGTSPINEERDEDRFWHDGTLEKGGFLRKSFQRALPQQWRIPDKIFRQHFCRNVEVGSRTLVSAALLGQESHSGFWYNDQLVQPGKLVISKRGKELSDQFWEELLAWLEAWMILQGRVNIVIDTNRVQWDEGNS